MKSAFTELVTLDASKTRLTNDGYMVAEARAARSGIQLYARREMGLQGDGTIRVWRSPDEVFSKDSMATFAFKPMTVNHPSSEVNSKTWKDKAVGHLGGDIARDGDFIRVPLVVMDQKAIDAIKEGQQELSAGYTCDIELYDAPQTSPDGETYDAIQKNIRINHVAIVQRGRAGPLCRIGDDAEHVWSDDAPQTQKTEDREMNLRTIMVDGLQVETTDAGAAAIEKLQKLLADANAKVTETANANKSAIDAKDGEIGELKAKVKKLEDGQIKPDDLNKMIADRSELIATAKKIDSKSDFTKLDDNGIRRTAVAAKLGDDAVKDVSDAEVAGMFKVLAADAKSGDPVADAFRGGARIETKTEDGHDPSDPTGQKAYERRQADAWKTKPAA